MDSNGVGRTVDRDDLGFSHLRLCVWTGVAAMAVFFLGVIPIGHLVPPPPANGTIEETARFYRDNADGIKLGALLVMFGGTMLVPLYVAIAYQMRRIEGRIAPLTWVQLCFGVLNAALFFTMALMWMVAAFRAERGAEDVQLLSDVAWHVMVIPIPPLFLQSIVIAIAILRDRSRRPIFPRWVGYFNLWAALLFIPGGTLPMYVRHGAFSWQGVFGFWTEAAVYSSFVGVMSFAVLRALREEQQGRRAAADHVELEVADVVGQPV